MSKMIRHRSKYNSRLADRSSSKRMSSVTFHSATFGGFRRLGAALPKTKTAVPERMTYKILLDGIDVTPKLLTPPALYPDETQIAVHDMSLKNGGSFILAPNTGQQQIFQTQLHIQTAKAESTFLSQYGTGGTFGTSVDRMRLDIHEAPNQRYESEGDIVNPYDKASTYLEPLATDEGLPSKISLVLTETPVSFLLNIVSSIEPSDTVEAHAITKENEYYEYITVGKGKNRKRLNAEIQTCDAVMKTRSTTMKRPQKRHDEVFVSGWDMLDLKDSKVKSKVPKDTTNVNEIDIQVYEKRLKDSLIDTTTEMDKVEDLKAEIEKLQATTEFQKATMIMERILDGNIFKEEQTRIRGLHPPDPFRKEIEFKYRLELLWVFTNSHVYDRPITMIDFNKKNEDIIAVGYGKFFFTEKKQGMVCIWNIKNPSQPERQYSFPVAVTGLSFSRSEPHILAVSFYDGTIGLLDIIDVNVKFVNQTNIYNSMTHGPLWVIKCVARREHGDQIVVSGEDGRVCFYRQGSTQGLIGIKLIRVTRMEGKLKGIKQLRTCPTQKVPISVFASVLCYTRVPYEDSLFLIGTDEGSIHKCSKYYLNQHLDIFLAHNGPVYQIAYSPFCDRIFLTCGADWSIRIWAEGIFEPLITLNVPLLAVQMAVWSPLNSTIIAGVCGSAVYIWDIRKKTYLPSSIIQSPARARLTTLAFTSSGRNIITGDLEGNLHLYSLEDIPFPPFYQSDALLHSIKNSLVIRPDLIKQLNRSMREFELLSKLKQTADVEKVISRMFGH